ncbi:helix-turn-helix transcriptional regulator [Streptomyces sp. TRM66268-LWL]|uniref:Helix-turn-helix transcriptional regulator n=1 Tax=Streptomyces polyasparticus TaxID=2767826 RepID=A0ABR7SX72_9ACTN|nr:helix-turn-helix transcriptional regulator [Streptomyces polyasparticus]MBC9719394.1 helix-turn-helix transcriptional regulator [Streptomyces polyasparticus]
MAVRGDTRTDDPAGSDEAADLFRAIGRMIKAARERNGLSQRELGQRVGYGEEQISSIERGRRTPQPDFLKAVDDLLGCGGLLALLAEDVERVKARRRVRHPEWFRDYAALEAEAVEICFYSTLTVPGLLQTERYARTIFTARRPLLDEETIEQRVAARLDRQQILNRWPPPSVAAVIEESVLRRTIGGQQVQREQVEHLAELSRLRHVDIQVLPLDCEGHAGMEGPFILLTPKGRPQMGYGEFQSVNRLITDPDEVRMLAARYGSIRGQALSPSHSYALVEKLLGAG